MSLKEAYTLAHSAQCRLQMETSRPERNLRFVVGHLMHYESLRLRIVEIEHDLSTTERHRVVDHTLQQPQQSQLSTGAAQTTSPLATSVTNDGAYDDDDEYNDEEFFDDDQDDAGLSLARFPSASTRQQPPPELEPDEEDYDDDDDEPISPEEPDHAILQHALRGQSDEAMTTMYNSVKSCRCHGKTATAPHFERMWQLPPTDEERQAGKEGVTRAVAQVKVDDEVG